MTRRLSPATYGRTLAFHMRAAEPAPRDRRHTLLLAMQWLAALLAGAGLAALAIYAVGERLL